MSVDCADGGKARGEGRTCRLCLAEVALVPPLFDVAFDSLVVLLELSLQPRTLGRVSQELVDGQRRLEVLVVVLQRDQSPAEVSFRQRAYHQQSEKTYLESLVKSCGQ